MAVINDRNQKLEDRLNKLEHICGVVDAKPKIFELISDEFAESKEKIAYIEQRSEERAEKLSLRMDRQEE